MARSRRWTPRADLALVLIAATALAGCAAPRESVSIAFDRVATETEPAVVVRGDAPSFPIAPPYRPTIDAGALDGEAVARMQRWRAEIDDFIAGLRVHDLKRREEVIRVAFEERYLTDRERVLREHRAYADDLIAKTDDAAYRRLTTYADEVAMSLARLAALSLYPKPADAAMTDEPGLDGLERSRRAEGRALWARCLAARERYESDVRQLLAEAADAIEVHLRDLLDELERGRKEWESETPLSRPAPIAGLVQEEGQLREGRTVTDLPSRVAPPSPAKAIRRPNLDRLSLGPSLPADESLRVEARVFAAQRGYTLASPRDPGRDVTAEFIAWRNGYRSTR